MQEVGSAAALLLAAVFAWAGAAKITRRAETAAAFGDLQVPASGVMATVVPVAEMAVAMLLVVAPRVGGVAALVALSAFDVVIALAIRRGDDVPCACFGGRPGDGVSVADLVRNGLLSAAAMAAVLTPAVRAPSLAASITVSAAAMAGTALVTVLRMRKRTGAVLSVRAGRAGPSGLAGPSGRARP